MNGCRIAFYAPMKPVDHPTPSGDRQMARLIVQALRENGAAVDIPSKLRTWMRQGGRKAQQDLARQSAEEVQRILAGWRATGRTPDCWVTYHLYHRAPDWIGPAISDALNLPYVVIEASRSPRRRTGEWAVGFEAADAALARADAVAYIHNEDRDGLAGTVAPDRLTHFPPFIDKSRFPEKKTRDTNNPVQLLTIAMMREGDKSRSYGVLADALKALPNLPWHLTIAGDGPARDNILRQFPADRITYLGAISPDDIADVYRQGDIFVWPAINEAYGAVLLEAQASGLSVIAGNSGGVAEIVGHEETGLVVPEGDVKLFSQAIDLLAGDPRAINKMGAAAAAHVRLRHDLTQARHRLADILKMARRNRYAATQNYGIS